MYLVPLDSHARTLLRTIVPKLGPWLPAQVRITDIATKGPTWASAERGGELNGYKIAQDLLLLLQDAQGPSRPVFVMAVSSDAIYSSQTPAYSFLFGLAQGVGSHWASVFGTRPMRVYQPEREQARLKKFMLRYIGALVCNQPRNTNPRSVLYSLVLGTPDIDRMIATLPARCRRS